MNEPEERMEPSSTNEGDSSKSEVAKSQRSVYKGVYKCGNKFKAQIQINRVQHYLGLFDDEIQAAVAYDNHARIILGNRARTNFDEFGHASSTFPVAPTEPIKHEKLKLEHHAVESKVRGSTKSRKRLYIGINQRPRRYSEDSYKAPISLPSANSFESQADMQDSATLLEQLKTHGSGSTDESVGPYIINRSEPDHLDSPVRKHQLRTNSSSGVQQLSGDATHRGSGYFPPATLPNGHPNGGFATYFPLPHAHSAQHSAVQAGQYGSFTATALHSMSINENSYALSADNLSNMQGQNPSDQGIKKVKSLSAKTSLESMRSCTPPPLLTSAALRTMSVPSSRLGGHVSHWAGVLQTDPMRQTQLWRGTWVAGAQDPVTGSIPKPPPSAFAKSLNHFEFFSEVEFTTDGSGNQDAPISGFMRGCFFSAQDDSNGVQTVNNQQNIQAFEDRELFVEFAPSGVAHRYTATGSGEGDCGAFILTGQFSTISCVLEMTRQYISE